jgi:hypothetical protein
MNRLLLTLVISTLPLTTVLACDGGCSFLQPPKDLQSIVGSDAKADKGREPVQDNCVGPHCARSSNPSPFSLMSADSEPVTSKRPRKARK